MNHSTNYHANLFAGNRINDGQHTWNFCYLHGEAEFAFLEGNCAPDICTGDAPMPSVPGNYLVSVNGQLALAVIRVRHGRPAGRVALLAESEALRHALTPEEWG